MDANLQREYEYNIGKLKDWQIRQIQGHQTRIKFLPKLESDEPNISFFAEAERKKAIGQLQNEDGDMIYHTVDLKRPQHNFTQISSQLEKRSNEFQTGY